MDPTEQAAIHSVPVTSATLPSSMGEKNRRPRRRLALAGVAVLVVVAILALTATLFVWPSTNVPRRSDAIVVLGGSGLRVQKGVALAHAGYAPNLVVSDPDRS